MTPPVIPVEVALIVPLIRLHVDSQSLDRALLRFQNWQSKLPAQTSLLNHRLYFLELVVEESGDSKIKENEQILDTLLDGTGIRSVGDPVEWKGKRYNLAWRKIGSGYGIEMCFKAEDGTFFHREFYD